jgi:hypothetical protein
MFVHIYAKMYVTQPSARIEGETDVTATLIATESETQFGILQRGGQTQDDGMVPEGTGAAELTSIVFVV